MSVTNQQGSIKKKFPLKLKFKAVCIRFSHLVTLSNVSSQVPIAVCKCLFRNTSAVIFLILIRPKDLNFIMNKRQITSFNLVLRNLVLKMPVTQQIMIHLPQSYRAISKTCKRRGELQAHRRKILNSFIISWKVI